MIEEAKAIIIYKRYDEESDDPDDGPIPPTYYFSVNNGAMKELNLINLKKAFPEEHDFHDKLDETFSGGRGTASYDNYHKMYKVNRVLAITVD